MKLCRISQNRLHKQHSKDFLIGRSRPLNITQLILGAFSFGSPGIYSKTTRSLWKYYRNEPALDNKNKIIDLASNNNSISFKLKEKITAQTGN